MSDPMIMDLEILLTFLCAVKAKLPMQERYASMDIIFKQFQDPDYFSQKFQSIKIGFKMRITLRASLSDADYTLQVFQVQITLCTSILVLITLRTSILVRITLRTR